MKIQMQNEKCELKNKGFTVWLTGLSVAGKSTIAHLLGKKLKEWVRNVEVED